MPPTGDSFKELWMQAIIKDIHDLPPSLARLSEEVKDIRTDVLEGNSVTEALFKRLDEARKQWSDDHKWTLGQVNRFKGGIAVLTIVGGLAWAYVMYQIQVTSQNNKDEVEFRIKQEGVNADVMLKLNAALAVPTDVQDLKDQVSNLIEEVHLLKQVVANKPSKVEIHQPPARVYITPKDQSRSPIPRPPEDGGHGPTSLFNRLIHP